MHDTVKRSAIQGPSQKGSVGAAVFNYGNVLCLEQTLEEDILYLDDGAENVEAAARLGINSVLFDTVEKTAARVKSRCDSPVPSYSRRRRSSSQYSSTSQRPGRMESD